MNNKTPFNPIPIDITVVCEEKPATTPPQAGPRDPPDKKYINAIHEIEDLVTRMLKEPQDPAMHTQIRGYVKVLIADRRERLYQGKLAFDREKWEFDVAEACLKKLPELKAVESSNAIPYKEKINRIRMKLFGCAPD